MSFKSDLVLTAGPVCCARLDKVVLCVYMPGCQPLPAGRCWLVCWLPLARGTRFWEREKEPEKDDAEELNEKKKTICWFKIAAYFFFLFLIFILGSLLNLMAHLMACARHTDTLHALHTGHGAYGCFFLFFLGRS